MQHKFIQVYNRSTIPTQTVGEDQQKRTHNSMKQTKPIQQQPPTGNNLDKKKKKKKNKQSNQNKQTEQITKAAKANGTNPIEEIFRNARKQKKIEKTPKEVKEEKKKLRQEKELRAQWRKEVQDRKNGNQDLTTTRVEAGLKIYSEEQLRIGQGGNTSKCPIDCDCCF